MSESGGKKRDCAVMQRSCVDEHNFTVMDSMWLDCCHSPCERFGGEGVACSCRKWAIWKENCSDLPGQELWGLKVCRDDSSWSRKEARAPKASCRGNWWEALGVEYLGHREGKEERRAFYPFAWVGVSPTRSHCQEVIGRVTFCMR